MEIESALIEQLSWRGILACVAVKLAGTSEATTASLAGLVKCQTAIMLDGLKELSVVAPDLVAKGDKAKWRCGVVKAGDGVVLQNLDSDKYRAFVDDLKKYWDFMQVSMPPNCQLPFRMDGRDGIQIRQFLAKHSGWTQEMWRGALNNRSISVLKLGVGSRVEPLWKWIAKLDMYLAGAIDKYGNQVNPNGKAAEVRERNNSAREQYLSGVK
jgi:hypothetical protein